MGLEHAEREHETEIDVGAPERPQPTAVWSWDDWDERGLPVEPQTPEATAADSARVLRELRAFHLYGRRPAEAVCAVGRGAVPALLHRYRDLSRLRHEYPVCLNGSEPATAVRPLSEWIDQLLSEHAAAGEEGEQRRQYLHRLEAIVRSLVADRDGERLSLLWDRAAARISEDSKLPADREKILRESIAISRGALPADAELVACGPRAAERLLRASAGVFWRERCEKARVELDALVGKLEDILNADFSQSREARTPERLRESLGDSDGDLDVKTMSRLLSSRPHESAIPEDRRRRIRSVLATLTRMRPAFEVPAGEGAPIRFDAVFDDCAAAAGEYRARTALMTDFFKAVRVARLEIQNRYRSDLHDPFFAGFDARYLSCDEVALCPPVLLRISGDDLRGAEVLIELLASGAPVKVLIELREIFATGEGEIRPVAAARLAAMAGSLQRAYVLQAPVSHAVVLRARLLDGLRYAGPALFCVYAPAPDDDPARSTYLRAAAAAESRVFPVLVFDPAKGETLADRVDLSGNTQGERSWPAEAFAYRDAGGEAASVDLAFTPLDYLYGDRRLEGEFWNLSPDLRHESLTPAHEYLEMPAEEASSRIPYVLTVDRDGRIGRAIATRAVVEAALSCRAFWRGVQEWGGIDNSHAKRAVAAEADRLAREKEREIEAIEKNYLAQLDTDVGELAREIVQRIASSLMGTEGEAFVAKPTLVAGAPAAAAPAPTAEPAASTPAEAEEEEAVSFDDPYIDTPLCTSCNECTQLNARMFAYNANKQAEIRDAAAGPFSDLVRAAELCPVHIIHPGKPKNPGEPGLEEWVARAARFN